MFFVNWINTLICNVPHISSNFQALWDKFRHSPDGRGLKVSGGKRPTRMVDETLAILSSLPRRLDAVVPGVTHELPLLPPNWKNTVTP